MYQSLRTSELQAAFSALSTADVPKKEFAELSRGQRDFQTNEVINRKKDGYQARDMNRYLHHLLKNGIIKTFKYKQARSMTFSKFCLQEHFPTTKKHLSLWVGPCHQTTRAK